jgi:CheY-like chemotaxis protein
MQEATTGIESARTDFVASLPNRIDAMRQALTSLAQHPESDIELDTLLADVRAAASGARAVGFPEATRRLEQAERAIAEVVAARSVDPRSLKRLTELLDELPALVWGASLTSGRTRSGKPATRPGCFVVFGKPSLCVALIADAKDAEVEVTDDPDHAQDLVFERDPDVMVVDVDLPRGSELIVRICFAAPSWSWPSASRAPVPLAKASVTSPSRRLPSGLRPRCAGGWPRPSSPGRTV